MAPETEEDAARIEELLSGPIVGHADPPEILNGLVVVSDLASIAMEDSENMQFDRPFGADNLADKSKNRTIDNVPEWVVSIKGVYENLETFAERRWD